DVVPGDWDNPVPVPFLAIAADTPFHFYVQVKEGDVEPIKKLLVTGLDWLGIGAKKSAGYGVFGKEEPATPAKVQAPPSKPSRPPEPPPSPPPPPTVPILWTDVELNLREGAVVARKGRQTASCRRDEVERELADALKKNRELRADVEVVKIPGGEYRILSVKTWKVPGK
ncbi:MAG TPA: hypothetical protein VFC23_18725, partial [Thermoanaerobaculia bacterium]|nr:hypothetical protein [Thermoanaerobaculia bacterium]